MIGDVLYFLLTNNIEVSQIVGGSDFTIDKSDFIINKSVFSADKTHFTTNIFPLKAQQKTKPPYITYQGISCVPLKTKDRLSLLDTYRVQINCYSDNYIIVNNLSEAVRNCLNFYSGPVQDINIDIILFEDQNDLFDEKSEFYQIALDFFIRIKK